MSKTYCVYMSKEKNGDRFYIGKSYVSKVEGGYKGSGVYLSNCIKKGIEFTTEILERFDTEADALWYENFLVKSHIDNPNNINLCDGGVCAPINTGEGSDCPRSILSNKEVVSIRRSLMNGASLKELSDSYGVGVHAISKIKRLKNWDYIKSKPRGYDDWLLSHGKVNNKITPWDAMKIRKQINDGVSQSELARLYKISPSSVCDIRASRTYDKPYYYG